MAPVRPKTRRKRKILVRQTMHDIQNESDSTEHNNCFDTQIEEYSEKSSFGTIQKVLQFQSLLIKPSHPCVLSVCVFRALLCLCLFFLQLCLLLLLPRFIKLLNIDVAKEIRDDAVSKGAGSVSHREAKAFLQNLRFQAKCIFKTNYLKKINRMQSLHIT